jgi:hypothetical protein
VVAAAAAAEAAAEVATEEVATEEEATEEEATAEEGAAASRWSLTKVVRRRDHCRLRRRMLPGRHVK